jgi:hypothetical protein
MNKEINDALWSEAYAYCKFGIHSDPLTAWRCAFRCWFRAKLEREMGIRVLLIK